MLAPSVLLSTPWVAPSNTSLFEMLRRPIESTQFTSLVFTERLKTARIAISMDGRGCWRDNVFVERLWRSVKYEEVYLHAYESVSAAKVGIGKYFAFFNARRPHSSLDGKTPDELYFASLPAIRKAA